MYIEFYFFLSYLNGLIGYVYIISFLLFSCMNSLYISEINSHQINSLLLFSTMLEVVPSLCWLLSLLCRSFLVWCSSTYLFSFVACAFDFLSMKSLPRPVFVSYVFFLEFYHFLFMSLIHLELIVVSGIW